MDDDLLHDLLAVGSWAIDEGPDRLVQSKPPQRESGIHYLHASAESCCLDPRSNNMTHTQLGQKNCCNRLPTSEDGLLETPPQNAIREVRVAQIIQRQHPACFVKVEGDQKWKKATAKPSYSHLRAERCVPKYASAYLAAGGEGGLKPSSPTVGSRTMDQPGQ